MSQEYPFSKMRLGAFETRGFPLVEFDRKPFDRYPVRGFALDWNQDLTLFQYFDTDFFQLDGYAVLRNSDIRRYSPLPADTFMARVARFQKIRPAKPKGVTIGSMREAAESAGTIFHLLTVHRERIKKNVCYVGEFRRASQRAIILREISAQAEWEPEQKFALRDITKLEFGGIYERLLHALAK